MADPRARRLPHTVFDWAPIDEVVQAIATTWRRKETPECRRRRERRPEVQLHEHGPRLRSRLRHGEGRVPVGLHDRGAERTPREVVSAGCSKTGEERAAGPKTRARRRSGTYEKTLGRVVAASSAADVGDAAGRAPP